MTIEVQLPIFVTREWQRHRTQSYNEMSARYAELPELFYIPSGERLKHGAQSKTNKQGSGEPMSEATVAMAQMSIARSCQVAFEEYRRMLGCGVSRELARTVLPVGAYTRMRATSNLLNWLRFLTLRFHPDAQWEIQQYAKQVHRALCVHYPRTMDLFDERRSREGER
jgi:thymidylate synthase (FAD)